MPYSNRHRYTSRRERLEKHRRNYRMVFLFLFVALLILAIKNRVLIWDTVRYWFN